MRNILIVCTQQNFAVTGVPVERDGETARDRRGKQSGKSRVKEAAYAAAPALEGGDELAGASKPTLTVALELRGGRSLAKLVDKLSQIDGVFAVNAGDAGLAPD